MVFLEESWVLEGLESQCHCPECCSVRCATRNVWCLCLEDLGVYQEALGPMVDGVAPKQWVAALLSPCPHACLDFDPFSALEWSKNARGLGLEDVVDGDWRRSDVSQFNSQIIN